MQPPRKVCLLQTVFALHALEAACRQLRLLGQQCRIGHGEMGFLLSLGGAWPPKRFTLA